MFVHSSKIKCTTKWFFGFLMWLCQVWVWFEIENSPWKQIIGHTSGSCTVSVLTWLNARFRQNSQLYIHTSGLKINKISALNPCCVHILFKPPEEPGEQRVIVSQVGKWTLVTWKKQQQWSLLGDAGIFGKVGIFYFWDTPGELMTWYQWSRLMLWSLQGPGASWASDCGLLLALAVTNSSPLFYRLGNNKQKRIYLKDWNKCCPLGLLQYKVTLTPSGFTTFVTVTDWKNDRVLGRFGVWPAGGVRIWSRPPEETAESRSEKRVIKNKVDKHTNNQKVTYLRPPCAPRLDSVVLFSKCH